MSTFVQTQVPNWRTLYRAAILEPDAAKVSNRIAEAEKEIVQRARELFQENRNNPGSCFRKTETILMKSRPSIAQCARCTFFAAH
jgi:hypothetical protein